MQVTYRGEKLGGGVERSGFDFAKLPPRNPQIKSRQQKIRQG